MNISFQKLSGSQFVENSTPKIKPKVKTKKGLFEKVKYLCDVQGFIIKKTDMLEMEVKETKELFDKLENIVNLRMLKISFNMKCVK